MTINPLLEELKKLRESSKYAVAQGTYSNLNEFKKYLHIEREVEKKLKTIITKASENNKSQLLLVCGNVGDGKSHILSHLHDELKDVISQFIIHNDATESHNPNESSNETLYKLLEGFKDDNVKDSNDKIILAINLGTLSKFIEEYGEHHAPHDAGAHDEGDRRKRLRRHLSGAQAGEPYCLGSALRDLRLIVQRADNRQPQPRQRRA